MTSGSEFLLKMNLKRLLFITNICLSGAVLWMAYNIVITLTSNKSGEGRNKSNQVNVARAIEANSGRTDKKEDYRVIIAHDIFKTTIDVPPGPAKPGPEKKPLKLADLNLKLKGTVVGENKDSYAVILDGTKKKEELYYLNGIIQGARIVRILTDRVVFDLGGNRESLMMTIDESAFPTAPKKKRSRKRLPRHARTPTK